MQVSACMVADATNPGPGIDPIRLEQRSTRYPRGYPYHGAELVVIRPIPVVRNWSIHAHSPGPGIGIGTGVRGGQELVIVAARPGAVELAPLRPWEG